MIRISFIGNKEMWLLRPTGHLCIHFILLAIFYTSTFGRSSYNPSQTQEDAQPAASKRVHASGKQPNLSYATPMEFKKAAVAADNVICSRMGKDILKKGGSAADAIVTTHCCVEVVNSHSTGLGGGGFMVYYDKKSGKSRSYDFRETLPAGYSDTQNKTLGETILVPGVLRGLEAVWKDFGKLNWTELWQPCIKLANEGFRIHEALGAGITKKVDYIMANLGLRELFAPDGTLLKLGHVLKRPKLARTFEMIASQGADVFYTGSMAEQIVNDIREAGGIMRKEDLAGFQVQVRDALQTEINGYKLLSTPAPSSGALMALCLKIMSLFKWKPKDLLENPALVYHQMIESLKFAYAPTTYLGDPRFTKHTKEVQDYMVSDKTAKKMFERIDNFSHPVEYYKPYSEVFWSENTQTSHMSLIDPNGNAVSLTSSINAYFGSKLRSRELGFIYNNELADFSEFWPTIYNLTSDKKMPGKRPMSKVMPVIFVKGGVVQGVWGAAGGFFIPSAITMSIANWLFFNDNVKVAITRPRLHCQLFPPTVVYEPTLPPSLISKIEDYGHKYVTNSTYDVSGQLNAIMGVVQAIVRTPGGKYAAESDYRKGGRPAGF